jgi:signal recognition particle subunit SRP54
MFQALGDKLEGVFARLRGQGTITEKNIREAMREIRLALLEADVHFRVVKQFVKDATEKAVGQEVLGGVNPGQQVVKIVHDELVGLMGGSVERLELKPDKVNTIVLFGLQGSGKTTFAAKLALRFKKGGRRAMLVACDRQRPAAITQLQSLGAQIDVPVHATEGESDPVKIAAAALEEADRSSVAALIIDTAGRLHIDEELMDELGRLKRTVNPTHSLLVADAMTGQDALTVAETFHERIGIDGVCLTKLDGDARGGAALSIRSVTGQPIRFASVGEKLDDLEEFHQQVKRMGSVKDILGMIPGLGKQMRGMELDDSELGRIEAMIRSMTPQERQWPSILDGSRKRRIARGAGVEVTDVNQLLKQFEMTRKMMKNMLGPGSKAGRRRRQRGGMAMPPGMMPPGLMPPG